MKKAIAWVLIILWMLVIFFLSHQPAVKSNRLSKDITKIIIETVEKIDPSIEMDKGKLNHAVRKNAHFFVYLVLGFLIANGLKHRRNKAYIIALIICILYAVSDEIHQLYIPGRGLQLKDIIIDSGGAVVGIIIHMGLSRFQ